MRCRNAVLLAACVPLFALAGPASAGLVIDENFDANPGIQSPVSMVTVDMMNAAMWMGGGTPQGGMWQYNDAGHAMGMLMGMGMGTMGMPTWTTLTYFVARPAAGWGGNRLDLSLSFQYETASPDNTQAKFGVYGWPAGAPVFLEDEFPGADGTELIGGLFSPSASWGSVRDRYFNGLDGYDYIGLTLTLGDTTGALVQGELAVDDVKVNIIPEPSAMLLCPLGIAGVAWIRRIRKRRWLKRATGPPG